MAILTRDPEATAASISSWLDERWPDRGGASVALDVPPGSGFSGETLLVSATFGDGSAEELVIRVAPTTHTVFWKPDFEGQYEVMAALAANTDVPMPEMLAFESDERWLGAPFMVMGRVRGEAPADRPAYTQEGFVVDATPEQRARLYDTALESMIRVHRADWRALGLQRILRPEYGAPGIDQQLGHTEEWWDAISDGTPNPVLEATWEWVRAHRPPTVPEDHLALAWGDARIGNQLFDDFTSVAVLDWELVEIGDPISDLGWWIFLDRHHSEMYGIPRLEGFASYEDTIARWEARTGRHVDPDLLEFYLVFAGLRFGIVMVRLATLLADIGLIPEAGDMATNNIVTHLLARILDLPAPGQLVII